MPCNHPIERASCDTLRSAVRWLLQLKVYGQRRTLGEVWQDTGEYARNHTELSTFVVRTLTEPATRTWHHALNDGLESQEFSARHASLHLSQEDIKQAFRAES